MSDTKTIYERLNDARKFVQNQAPQKNGRNSHSNYDYFTPEQVEQIVQQACETVECMCLCNLKADAFGYFQTLKFFSIKDPEAVIECELRTKHGEITATNATQQMGGVDTYSERYVKMKFFGIKDNHNDPDAQDHTGKAKEQKEEKPPVEVWFNPKDEKHLEALQKYRDDGMSGEDIVTKIREIPKWGISKANAQAIINGDL